MDLDRCNLLCLDAATAEGIRADLPERCDIERAAALAQACADPTRLTLLLALGGPQELCVCDLTWVVAKPQNLVSHHLRKLREAGLVQSRREAKIVFYSLTPRGRSGISAFAGADEALHA